MGIYTMKLPDVGEGIAVAELTGWHVAIGDVVREDDIIAEVMTDKAAVEIPSVVTGKVVWLGGNVGDTMSIGGDLIRFEVDGAGNTDAMTEASVEASPPAPAAVPAKAPPLEPDGSALEETAPPMPPVPPVVAPASSLPPGRPLAAPSIRRRARESGIDLRHVRGTGPAGRILREDLESILSHGQVVGARRGPNLAVEERKVVGMRRKIAERMSLSKSRIPHFTIVEEVDVTDLEALRETLNGRHAGSRGKLTVLPFIVRAISRACASSPSMNGHYEDEAGVFRVFGAVHCGIATQTESGLLVPVLRDAETRSVWSLGEEIRRLSGLAREGRASREDLGGSTITVSSLGPLGAIATTPIINHPEVCVVGVNRVAIRPVWNGSDFVPRSVMNLSCSFDHRIVDGWDAAVFVRDLRQILEKPALMFMEDA